MLSRNILNDTSNAGTCIWAVRVQLFLSAFFQLNNNFCSLKCFDTVVWAAGRASGLFASYTRIINGHWRTWLFMQWWFSLRVYSDDAEQRCGFPRLSGRSEDASTESAGCTNRHDKTAEQEAEIGKKRIYALWHCCITLVGHLFTACMRGMPSVLWHYVSLRKFGLKPYYSD